VFRRAAAAESGGRATDANGSPPNHQPARPGRGQDGQGLLRAVDVAVGQHRARQLPGGAGDEVVSHLPAIHLLDSTAMHGQQINGMFGKQIQQRVKPSAESKPIRVFTVSGMATASRNAPRMASISPARAAGRPRRICDKRPGRAAQVQINRRDGILLQGAGRARQRGDVVADHLRDDGPPGGFCVMESRIYFSGRESR